MTSELSDVIATASLLLAVFTALMGFWYADVSKAIRKEDPTLPAEKKTLRNEIEPVFVSKALPLAFGSSLITAVFFWRSLQIVIEAVQSWGTGAAYADLKAALVATEVLMIGLTTVTVVQAARLGRKCLGLR